LLDARRVRSWSRVCMCRPLTGVFMFCWVPFFTINIVNAICIRYDLFDLSAACHLDPQRVGDRRSTQSLHQTLQLCSTHPPCRVASVTCHLDLAVQSLHQTLQLCSHPLCRVASAAATSTLCCSRCSSGSATSTVSSTRSSTRSSTSSSGAPSTTSCASRADAQHDSPAL